MCYIHVLVFTLNTRSMKVAICCCLLAMSFFFARDTYAQTGWQWGYAGVSPQLSEAGYISVDGAGNVYSTGYSGGADSIQFGSNTLYNPTHNFYTFVTKANATGYVWAVGLTGGDAVPFGIAADNAGGAYLLGSFTTHITLGSVTLTNPISPMTADFLFRINASGAVVWGKALPFSTSNIPFSSNTYNKGICVSPVTGNVYVAGSSAYATVTIDGITLSQTGTGANLYLAEISTTGTAIRARNFGPYGYVTALQCSARSNVYMSGFSRTISFGSLTVTDTTADDMNFVVKFDSSLNALWAKGFRKQVTITDLAVGKDEAVYLTGNTDSAATHIDTAAIPYLGIKNTILVRYDSAGHFGWARWLLANGGTGYCVAADACGKIWMGCQLLGSTVTYNDTVIHYTVSGTDPLLLTEFNENGHYQSSVALPSGSDDLSTLVVDNNGSFYLCGDYVSSTPAFGPDVLPAQTAENYFIARYTYQTTACGTTGDALGVDLTANAGVNLYPNPATDVITIEPPTTLTGNTDLVISDLTGRQWVCQRLANGKNEITVRHLPGGVYVCRITGVQPEVLRKLVITHR